MKINLRFCCLIGFFMMIQNCFSQGAAWVSGLKATGGANDLSGYRMCQGQAMAMDSLGNVYVTGYFTNRSIVFGSFTLNNADTTGSVNDVFIVKFDDNNNVVWAKSVGMAGKSEIGYGIAVDVNGNVLVTGQFKDTITFDAITITGLGNSSVFTVKYDQNGNALWAKSVYGNVASVGSAGGQGRAIATDGNGDVYITGFFLSESFYFGTDTTIVSSPSGYIDHDADFFIAKYNSSGHFIWARSAGGSSATNPLAAMNDQGLSITMGNAGNIYAAGQFACAKMIFESDTLANFVTGNTDVFVVNYNAANGSVIWAKKGGGYYNENLTGISSDHSGNAIITGYSNSYNYFFDADTLYKKGYTGGFVVKYNSNGNVVWAKDIGYFSSDIKVRSVYADANDNVSVLGTFYDRIVFAGDTIKSGDLFVFSYDNMGNEAWELSTGVGAAYSNAIVGNGTDMYVSGGFTGVGTISAVLKFNNSLLPCPGPSPAMDFFLGRISTSALGIKDIQDFNHVITIKPNPSNGIFSITTASEIKTVEVLNVFGQQVYLAGVSGKMAQVDLSKEATGIYYVMITDHDNKSTVKKIMVCK